MKRIPLILKQHFPLRFAPLRFANHPATSAGQALRHDGYGIYISRYLSNFPYFLTMAGLDPATQPASVREPS